VTQIDETPKATDSADAAGTSQSSTLEEIGARAIPEFDGVHDVWPRGKRLAAVREAAEKYKRRFKEQGTVTGVKSVDVAGAPYPVNYAFNGAVRPPYIPLITMINRMVVVQYEDRNGTTRTLVFEPTMPEGSAEAAFYDNLQKMIDRTPGEKLVEKFVLKYYDEPDTALAKVGLTPDDVDFCSFDHLHVQDPRMILGSSTPIEGENEPRQALFGNAKMLAHRKELATLKSLHPMQWAWYVEGSLEGVDVSKFALFDGDIELDPVHAPDGLAEPHPLHEGAVLDQPEERRVRGDEAHADLFVVEPVEDPLCVAAMLVEERLEHGALVGEDTVPGAHGVSVATAGPA